MMLSKYPRLGARPLATTPKLGPKTWHLANLCRAMRISAARQAPILCAHLEGFSLYAAVRCAAKEQ
jgi:hypothetical protein